MTWLSFKESLEYYTLTENTTIIWMFAVYFIFTYYVNTISEILILFWGEYKFSKIRKSHIIVLFKELRYMMRYQRQNKYVCIA